MQLWQGHDEAVKEFKRRHIEMALEKDRRDYRAGYWKRWITLRDGRLKVRGEARQLPI